jgi:hypothetical protein
MPRISDITSANAKQLAQYIGTKYGNGNGVLSRAEVTRALKDGRTDAQLITQLKDVFGASAPTSAAGLLKAIFEDAAPPPAPAPTGGAIGQRPGGPGPIFLRTDGAFSLSPTGGTTEPVQSAKTLYEGVLLLNEGINPYAAATPATRSRSLTYLADCANKGVERNLTERTPSETTMALMSGSASALLALAQAAKTPAEANTRQKAISTYLNTLEKELPRGLRTSMVFNLDGLRTELKLSPADGARLDKLKATLLPTRPPYEKWLSSTDDTIKIRQYAHVEFYDLAVTPYRQRGFKETTLPNGHVLFEKKMEDPTRQNPPVNIRIEMSKVEDYSTDRHMLAEMNDPSVDVQIYSGHSNLGGNIAQALKLAPTTELGEKLTFLWMCRGKQNVADFSNRFPKSHLITTHQPPDGYSIVPMAGAMVDMFARRADYDFMKEEGDPKKFLLMPNDRRLYDHRDFDSDGRLDTVTSAADRVFDIYPRAPKGKSTTFKPGPAQDPARLDGGAVVNALGFANTLLTYHLEHGDGTSPIGHQFPDHFRPEGFYSSTGDEVLKITKHQENGKTEYGVAVNSKFGNMSEEAMGMAMLYELNRFTMAESGKPMTLDDKARGLMFAAEYLSYMVGDGAYSDELVRNLAKANGWPSTIDFSVLKRAMENDQLGYVSKYSVDEFKRLLGSQLGDGHQIR